MLLPWLLPGTEFTQADEDDAPAGRPGIIARVLERIRRRHAG